jgi:signal transduction histidine kinase
MTRTTRLWLVVGLPALAAGAVAAAITAASDHLDVPRLQALLTALTGWSFIGAGLLARTRRPRNRTGLLLIAVGFSWLVGGALIGANDSVPFTLGVALVALPAGFLIHLLLAYPSGVLQSRWERFLVVTGYFLVLAGQVAAELPFEPDPLACAECPDNAFLISDNGTAAALLNGSLQIVAVAFLLAVVVTLIRRWRHSSPAARRALTPVLLAGGLALFLFAISVGVQSFSRTVSDVAGWGGSTVLIGVPFFFVWGLLSSRLARADISRALAEDPGGGVQERVRQLLHDPSAEVLYRCSDPPGGCVDVDGRPRQLVAEPGRAVTPIEREGKILAAIVHDEALLDEPELLEQVAAAVGLEVERDNNLFALQASDRRSRALLNALPDKMFRLGADGTILDIQESLVGTRFGMEVGSNAYDGNAPREFTDLMMETGRRALETGELQTTEWKNEAKGIVHYAEGRFIPSGEDEFFVVIRDVTERKQQELEQAALRRVAIAVAAEGRTEQIFDLVSEEVARLLGADAARLIRYEPRADEAVIVGGWRKPDARAYPVGGRYPMQGSASQAVYRTGRPLRRELGDDNISPELAAQMQQLHVNSLVAAPITLTGRPWGAVVATLTAPHTFPKGAEERLGAFTKLVSLALANEEAREELAASRARLVSAGDEARRRLERNLHDGAQQRLVSVSVSLRLAQAKLAANPGATDELLAEANSELAVALEELRELARGLHPAVLTERGLGPALASLADRALLPVELERLPDERLPRPVEAAAYYVVSEALANIAKYAHATGVKIRVVRDGELVVIEVVDDGVGGAAPERGTGLRGLVDRVEALDGHLQIDSPPGKGTTIRADLPVRLSTLEATGQPHVREPASMPALDA